MKRPRRPTSQALASITVFLNAAIAAAGENTILAALSSDEIARSFSCVSCVGVHVLQFNSSFLSFFFSSTVLHRSCSPRIFYYISPSIISRYYDQSMLSKHILPSSTFQYLFITKMRRRGGIVCVCVCVWKRTLIMN